MERFVDCLNLQSGSPLPYSNATSRLHHSLMRPFCSTSTLHQYQECTDLAVNGAGKFCNFPIAGLRLQPITHTLNKTCRMKLFLIAFSLLCFGAWVRPVDRSGRPGDEHPTLAIGASAPD